MHERELDEELTRVEAQMASFHPGPSRLDRDRTMFLAGRANVDTAAPVGSGWRWPTAFGAMTAVTACLMVAMIVQRQSLVAPQLAQPVAPLSQTPAQLADSHDRGPAVEPQPAVASLAQADWLPAAHGRRDFDPGQLWDVSFRLSIGLHRKGADARSESVDRWPKRVRQIPQSPPYAEQRRALLEEISRPVGRNPGEPIPSFPLGV